MYSNAEFKKLLQEQYSLTSGRETYEWICSVTGKPYASVKSQLADGKKLPDWLQVAAKILFDIKQKS